MALSHGSRRALIGPPPLACRCWPPDKGWVGWWRVVVELQWSIYASGQLMPRPRSHNVLSVLQQACRHFDLLPLILLFTRIS